MSRKKTYLLLVAVVSIILLFAEPSYHLWLTKRITDPDCSILDQARHLSLEDRNAYKYGASYLIYDHITQSFKGISDVLLLLPPDGYLKFHNIGNITIPEPAAFYYFTGIKAVQANVPQARSANYVLIASKKGFNLKKIKRQSQLDSVIALYNQYSY